jgi:hypothetical protein
MVPPQFFVPEHDRFYESPDPEVRVIGSLINRWLSVLDKPRTLASPTVRYNVPTVFAPGK